MAKGKVRDPNQVITTFRYRVKDASEQNRLIPHSFAVNCVLNYGNEASLHAIRNHGRFLSAINLKNLTSGAAKELGISSVTVQAVCEE